MSGVPNDLSEWRRLADEGMMSALGEYTPPEFISLCDEVDALRQRLETADALLQRIEKKGHMHGCILCGVVTRTNGEWVKHHDDDCPLAALAAGEG